MTYLISFLEGIITFVSPCLLPMLPIYISYFAGSNEVGGARKTLKNSLAFTLGFTLVFMVLGLFAGAIGGFFSRYQVAVNIICGLIIIVFGLVYLDVIRLSSSRGGGSEKLDKRNLGFFSSLLFGIVFSISWTPCVGAFLGSALILASQQGSAVQGLLMLLCYSLGLGIPFVLSALLIGRMQSAFDFIKRHMRTIQIISGSFLILIGVLMISGVLSRFMALLA